IQDFRLAIGRHKYIAGFDIAMNDPVTMRRFQALEYLNGKAKESLQLHRFCGIFLLANQPFDRLALEQRHYKEGLAVLPAEFIDGADVGRSQSRRRGGLATKAS